MAIKNVFVVGAGLMGSGIAQVCACAGLKVRICDVAQEALEKARKNIAWSAGKMVEKGKVLGTLEEIMARITAGTDMAAAAQADLVIEAVYENLELKREIFKKVDELAPSEALLASNTSAISITELAACTKRPEKVFGLHFFNPVPMMQAVEVIRGYATSEETFETGRQFALTLGKEPIMVRRDVGGFIINRVRFMLYMEAMRLVENDVTTVDDVDRGLRLAEGRKMGVFETGDLVGLDVSHGAMIAIYEETKDPRWYPPEILRRKVKLGNLGRKTGKGWYVYDKDGNKLGPA